MPTRMRSILRIGRTVLVLAALLTAAGAGGVHIAQKRLGERVYVDLGGAVLTADPVSVGTADAGVVSEMLVTDKARVVAGQDLAKVTLTASDTTKPAQTRVLRAPMAGTVSAVSVAAGGVVRPGEPVVTLYDPARLTFQAQVPVKQLRQMRLGMKATIVGPGLDGAITARLDRVVPRVGADPLTVPDGLTIVLVPDPAGAVATLVPGLQFRATVDTRTAAGATPVVNSAG